MTQLGLNGLHTSSPRVQDFVGEFQVKKADCEGNARRSLLACWALSYMTWRNKRAKGETVDLVNLLVGFNEGCPAVGAGKFGSLVVLGNLDDGILTAPLAALPPATAPSLHRTTAPRLLRQLPIFMLRSAGDQAGPSCWESAGARASVGFGL